jgi:hypothetical protein
LRTSGLVYDYSSNNVGIGTASPSAPLTITQTASNAAGRVEFYSDTNPFSFYRANGTPTAITKALTGNVLGGIAGFGANDSTGFNSGPSARIRFLSTEDQTNSSRGADMVFETVTTSGQSIAERMRLTNAGNIGIGQTSPTYKLDVTGLGRFTGLVDAANFVATSTSATTTLAGQLAVGSNALNVLSNGAIGIGTASPSDFLHVRGSGALDAANGTFAKIESTGSNDAGVSLKTQSGNTWALAIGNLSGQTFYVQEGSTQYLTIKNITGNVGIGETAPGSKLSVSGGATIGASYDTTAAPTNGLIIEGNVGIGTTTPWGKLSVTNTGSGPSFVVEDDTSPDSTPFVINENGQVGIGTNTFAASVYRFNILSTDGSGLASKFETNTAKYSQLIFCQHQRHCWHREGARYWWWNIGWKSCQRRRPHDGQRQRLAVRDQQYSAPHDRFFRQRRCCNYVALAHALGDRHHWLRRAHEFDRRGLALPR